MKRGMALLLVILMFGVIVAGCINQSQTTPTNTQEPPKTSTSQAQNVGENPTTTAQIEESKYPLTIVDFAGRNVTIEKEPQRVISLAPSITETLFSIGAGDKVVGVTEFDDYPPQVANITKIGTTEPNIEQIALLEPDLIIGIEYHMQYIDQLEKIAPVIIVEPKNIDEIYKQIELLGKVTNREGYAKSVVNEMKTKVEEIKAKVGKEPKPKVFYIAWWNPIYTAGKGTFIGDLIKLASGENVFNDVEGWAQVSLEEVLARDPDVIILAHYSGTTAEELCDTELAKTKALREGNVYTMSDDNIISRPGPRIVLGLEELAKYIHPAVFNLNPQPLMCNATATG
ncbi:hypothetical protein PAP_06225 [Palaeococcus pacificus DY20341]|uniref:Fe/B12 periplasmic-binding domain-containing protein n=1 Tax=Palaeococcus pacificus DY20341 TaxID=1343739 RepID=A0A075LYJ1_9EURY|nr:ABC transporter substrate-binding protein [Palaeococcus pacificus]AIF69643.1 hypothetical protein PAP_06225 [Palaeococcus pacificus DY20341]